MKGVPKTAVKHISVSEQEYDELLCFTGHIKSSSNPYGPINYMTKLCPECETRYFPTTQDEYKCICNNKVPFSGDEVPVELLFRCHWPEPPIEFVEIVIEGGE